MRAGSGGPGLRLRQRAAVRGPEPRQLNAVDRQRVGATILGVLVVPPPHPASKRRTASPARHRRIEAPPEVPLAEPVRPIARAPFPDLCDFPRLM
jgi:hypothetical protein